MSASSSKPKRERLTFAPPPPPDPLPNRCEYANGLHGVCAPMLAKVRKSPTEIEANVALLKLQMQYWQRHEAAPKAHRDHIGARDDHTCLFQVYRYYFFQLRDLLWSVNPPPLRRQSQRVADQRPQIAGIFLGEDVSNS